MCVCVCVCLCVEMDGRESEGTVPVSGIAMDDSVCVSTAQVPKRTSGLKAPIMLLEGHGGEVYTCRMSPNGEHLASAGFDRSIRLCILLCYTLPGVSDCLGL